MEFDVLIFCSDRYIKNLPFVYEGIVHNLYETPDNIYCVSPNVINSRISGISYILDNDIVDSNYKINSVKNNWIKQQYIKLFQNLSQDNYLVIDGDILINKKISILTSNYINLFVSNICNYEVFNRYNIKMFGLVKSSDFTFVNDLMFFKRDIIKRLILERYPSIEHFIEKSNEVVEEGLILSEYELYGAYVYSNFDNLYKLKQITRNIKPISVDKNLNELEYDIIQLT